MPVDMLASLLISFIIETLFISVLDTYSLDTHTFCSSKPSSYMKFAKGRIDVGLFYKSYTPLGPRLCERKCSQRRSCRAVEFEDSRLSCRLMSSRCLQSGHGGILLTGFWKIEKGCEALECSPRAMCLFHRGRRSCVQEEIPEGLEKIKRRCCMKGQCCLKGYRFFQPKKTCRRSFPSKTSYSEAQTACKIRGGTIVSVINDLLDNPMMKHFPGLMHPKLRDYMPDAVQCDVSPLPKCP